MSKQRTRKTKQEEGCPRRVKAKFAEDRVDEVLSRPLKPLNPAQEHYIECINTKPLIIATGYPGTAKTYIPAVIACDKFKLGEINKIYLIRPPVSSSKSLGYFAGTLEEKAAVWLGEILAVMRERLGRGALEIALKRHDIEFLPLEALKGRNLKNCFVIVDEAEDLTEQEIRTIVTRSGENCTMILSGDIGQSDLKCESGLKLIRDMANKNPELEDTVGIVDFNRPSDIVRSKVCKLWTLAFSRKGLGDYTKRDNL